MKRIKEFSTLLFAMILIILFFHLTGIGCPIKKFTGISCAGCGMTRAILAALKLHWKLAFFYHPLFWLPPLILVLYLFFPVLFERKRKLIVSVTIVLFLIIYFVRLLHPNEIVAVHWKDGWIHQWFNTIKNYIFGGFHLCM